MQEPIIKFQKAIQKLNYFEKKKLLNLLAHHTSNGMSRFYMAFEMKNTIKSNRNLKLADL
tara:strand:- start:1465 stop:1644 length:180 start_codon:yes stop_codon:yes gene_type:complete